MAACLSKVALKHIGDFLSKEAITIGDLNPIWLFYLMAWSVLKQIVILPVNRLEIMPILWYQKVFHFNDCSYIFLYHDKNFRG